MSHGHTEAPAERRHGEGRRTGARAASRWRVSRRHRAAHMGLSRAAGVLERIRRRRRSHIDGRRTAAQATVPDSPNDVQRYFMSALLLTICCVTRSHRHGDIARAVRGAHAPDLARRSARATRSRSRGLDSLVARLTWADPSTPTATTASPRHGVAPAPMERRRARRRGRRDPADRSANSLQTRS